MNEMKKYLSAAAMAAVFLTGSTSQAQRQRPEAPGGEAAEAKQDPGTPVPPEYKSETKHDWTVGSRPVHYTATAGTLQLKNEMNQVYCSMFYVAYTEDGVPPRSRPVTFLYNGGPGSASVWLHMGSVGPIRVVTSSGCRTSTACSTRATWSSWMHRRPATRASWAREP